jgi:hypothetical protein
MNGKVHYGRAAKLYLIPRPQKVLNGTVVRGGAVYDGTLAGAVRRFMALREDEYIDASVGFEVGVVEGNISGRIGPPEIREMFMRPDFPKAQHTETS